MKQKYQYPTVIGLGIIALLLLASRGATKAQEVVPVAKNYVAWAQEFLREMYPELKGKRYGMLTATYVPFDDSTLRANRVKLYVGEGPQDYINYDFLAAAVTGGIRPPAVFSPPVPGLESLSAPPPAQAAAPQYFMVCPMGGNRMTQLRVADFRFDDADRLARFWINGIDIDHRDAEAAFNKLVSSHPDMTDEDFIAAFKKAGGKYGPNDEREFAENLPVAKLERFLGPLEVVSIHRDATPFPSRSNPEVWPFWVVVAKSQRGNDAERRYEMTFEQFNGDLVHLVRISTEP